MAEVSSPLLNSVQIIKLYNASRSHRIYPQVPLDRIYRLDTINLRAGYAYGPKTVRVRAGFSYTQLPE